MRIGLGLVGMLGLAACSPGISKDNLPQVVDRVDAGRADYLLKDFPGAKLSARIDNGGTLVLKVTDFAAGTQSLNPNALRKHLRPTVCDASNYGKLIEQGGKVRIEMVSKIGTELPPVQFARC